MTWKRGLLAVCTAAALLVTAGFLSMPAALAAGGQTTDRMVSISGMAHVAGGNICIVDTENHSVWMRTKKDSYDLLAGTPGKAGYINGALTQARFNLPWSVAAFDGGYLVSDTGNHVIRRIKDGQVTAFAGAAKEAGSTDAKGRAASFSRPTGLAVAEDNTVYVADTGNHTIRAIDQNGNVTTFAGAAGQSGCKSGSCADARFCEPTGLYYRDGVLYVADSGNHRICSIRGGKVKVIAGSRSGEEGDATGNPLQAALSNPQQAAVYKGALYIADTGNGCVKCLRDGKLETLLEANSRREGRIPAEPRALMARNGYLYIGDMFAGDIYRVKL